MKTIVITSQKGGSGKTTLAAHLAVEAERIGDSPSWLIDTDKQGTLSLWHERRESDTPQRADVPFARLAGGLKLLQDPGAAYCCIDTPPTISEQNVSILALADLVLIPVRPSPADLWPVSETVTLVKEANKPFLFVITQAQGQGPGEYHRSDHRSSVRAWPRRAIVHCRSRALRHGDDEWPNRARDRAEKRRGPGNRSLMA